MKFPCGISDFYSIINEGYIYVDRTTHIPLIEEAGKHLLFLRPRRFGKSLLLSMLENYYDLGKADEFSSLFANLNIGKKPTALHNQYFVLKWDFSAVSPQGTPDKIEQNLHNYINGRIKSFAAYYNPFLTMDIEVNPLDSQASFQSLLLAVRQSSHKLYLLIDEYDNFANELMMGSGEISKDRYQTLVHGEGCIKALFKVVKSASAGEGLARAFITGVSPVVMSDITSGHNIAENIYLEPEFNDLCGFWETEISVLLKQIVTDCQLASEKTIEALNMMRAFYNGYCFSYQIIEAKDNQKTNLIYNPTLALYFMKHFQKRCSYPREMLDNNLAMDKNKIAYISSLPNGKKVIERSLNEANPLTIERFSQRFGIEDMFMSAKDNIFMISLLYYFGVLTISDKKPLDELILRIPNLVVKKLYIERIQDMLLPDFSKDETLQLAKHFYQSGDIQPLIEFIEQHYFKVFNNRDYRWTNELTIKTAFLTLLFNDIFYIMDSETSLDRGYADLTMIVRPDMRQYQLLDILLEFKYVSLQELGLSGTEVKALNNDAAKALSPVKEKITESKKKLKEYRQTLQKIYGDRLKLQTYTVVALGFDKIIRQQW